MPGAPPRTPSSNQDHFNHTMAKIWTTDSKLSNQSLRPFKNNPPSTSWKDKTHPPGLPPTNKPATLPTPIDLPLLHLPGQLHPAHPSLPQDLHPATLPPQHVTNPPHPPACPSLQCTGHHARWTSPPPVLLMSLMIPPLTSSFFSMFKLNQGARLKGKPLFSQDILFVWSPQESPCLKIISILLQLWCVWNAFPNGRHSVTFANTIFCQNNSLPSTETWKSKPEKKLLAQLKWTWTATMFL